MPRTEPVRVTFENVSTSELTPAQIKMVGSEQGRLLRFRNAVLARAERNKNRDRVTAENITELAKTLPLTALDLEHRPQEIVGFFTAARPIQDVIEQDGRPVETTALSTDGVIFADRYPDVARDVVSGRAQLSIEADAEKAFCSVCSREFGHGDTYCEHLVSAAAKRMFAAERSFARMVAAGGGVTRNPAGTETRFDHNHVRFVASVASGDADDTDAAPSASLALEADASIDARKAENATRAAARLVANFASDALPALPYLNTFRPVFSPLLYVPNPPFVDEIVNRVKQSISAELQTIVAELRLPVAVAGTTPSALATEPETRENIQQIVADRLQEKSARDAASPTETTPPETTPIETASRAAEDEGPAKEEDASECDPTVTASAPSNVAAKPTSVGLIGFAWDMPITPKFKIRGTWS